MILGSLLLIAGVTALGTSYGTYVYAPRARWRLPFVSILGAGGFACLFQASVLLTAL